MRIFIKIISWIFYILVALCLVFFVLYKTSEPVDETYFQYFLYAGFGAIGLSLIRFVMRFMY